MNLGLFAALSPISEGTKVTVHSSENLEWFTSVLPSHPWICQNGTFSRCKPCEGKMIQNNAKQTAETVMKK